MKPRSVILLTPLVVASLAACGSDNLAALTDATELRCPVPGDLPFRLASHGFQSQNTALVASRPRDKAEASDTLGVPGGASANTYLADDAAPVTALSFVGVKARSEAANGLTARPLAGEHVSLWRHDDATAAWSMLGRAETASDGSYAIPASAMPANGPPVYAILEADGSCAEHHVALLPPGSKVVITDIDGTLTTSDSELLMELADATYVPQQMAAADAMAQAWAAKGYPIIYLTARPHILQVETRTWLRDRGFPAGPVITAATLGVEPAGYKTVWGQRMVADFGWVPVAAYGNADTDITAYAAAGIPKDATFIIGSLAGTSGTVAIDHNDFTAHIASFIAAQPDNR